MGSRLAKERWEAKARAQGTNVGIEADKDEKTMAEH